MAGVPPRVPEQALCGGSARAPDLALRRLLLGRLPAVRAAGAGGCEAFYASRGACRAGTWQGAVCRRVYVSLFGAHAAPRPPFS